VGHGRRPLRGRAGPGRGGRARDPERQARRAGAGDHRRRLRSAHDRRHHHEHPDCRGAATARRRRRPGAPPLDRNGWGPGHSSQLQGPYLPGTQMITARTITGPLSAVALLACGDNTPMPPPVTGNLRLVPVVTSGLVSPLYLTAPPGDVQRLFIVEQPGRIRIVQNGALLPTPFLDITDRVESGGEEGLLSVAFHPNYGTNHYLYVDYTHRNAAGDTLYTLIERYTTGADSNVADTAYHKLILTIVQPYTNHNGGLVLFGRDGMLYIGMGDGGSGGDPENRAQNTDSLLGKLLRIDVNGGDPYVNPPNNPYAGGGGRGEIWAIGLRNPWRFG